MTLLSSGAAPTAGAEATQSAPRQTTGTIDDILASVNDVVPNFGGAWVEGDALAGEHEVLHLWLVDQGVGPSRDTAIEAARAELVGKLGERFDQDLVVVHDAEYRWDSLTNWAEVAIDLLTLPGAGWLDIDEKRNRLVLAIDSPDSQRTAIRRMLDGLGVPAAALLVEEGGPADPALLLRRRPAVGGVQVENETGTTCTLGFPSRLGGNQLPGFLAASHCSLVWGGRDAGRYWQPIRPVGDGDQFGHELADPLYFEGDPCPSGRRCRYSDANAVLVDQTPGVRLGHIARNVVALVWDGMSTYTVIKEVRLIE